MKLFRKEYLVCINYESGIQMKMWCEEFELNIVGSNKNAKWKKSGKVDPMWLNLDKIESVYIIDKRIRLNF